jgi:hypothetical protein
MHATFAPESMPMNSAAHDGPGLRMEMLSAPRLAVLLALPLRLPRILWAGGLNADGRFHQKNS